MNGKSLLLGYCPICGSRYAKKSIGTLEHTCADKQTEKPKADGETYDEV